MAYLIVIKTIFPIFSIVWCHKGKIVGRKVRGQSNEQDIQKGLLSLKMCHHSLLRADLQQPQRRVKPRDWKDFFFLFCTCTSPLLLPFHRLWTAFPQGLGIPFLSVKMASPDDKGYSAHVLQNQAVTISVLWCSATSAHCPWQGGWYGFHLLILSV